MVRDFCDALEKIGLRVNDDKCVVQCSRARTYGDSQLIVGSRTLPIVRREDGFRILGTTLSLDGKTDIEFQNRMRAAWGKFHGMWPLLGKRDTSVRKRLRLFNSTVSRTALWCSESWALTVDEKQQLRTTQREMLRRIAGPRRVPEESYVDWIQRATPVAENRAREAGVPGWLDMHLEAKWAWAAKVVNMEDSRLARRVVLWRDSEWWREQDHNARTSRPVRKLGGLQRRWEDDLRKFCRDRYGEQWQHLAKRNDWSERLPVFQQWALR